MWTACSSKIVWFATFWYIKNMSMKFIKMYSMFNTSMYLFLSLLFQNKTLPQLKEWLKRKNQQINACQDQSKSFSKTTENLTLTFHKLFTGWKKLIQELGEEMVRGHLKSMFTRNFNFLIPSSPLVRPCSLYMYHIKVLSLYWVTTPLKKSSAVLTNFRMKHWCVKTEKRFFCRLKR